MKAYIVTGCAGFIGSHLCETLLKSGHYVIGIDDMSTGTKENLDIIESHQNFQFVKCSVTDFDRMSARFEDAHDRLGNPKIDTVFHTAALARIQPSIQHPDDCLDRNIKGLMNILEFMRANEIKNIVFSSSSSIYGLKNAAKLPLKEEYEPDCLNQYSWSKYAGEKLIETYCKLYKFNGVNLRYFNVYGPREVLEGDYAPLIGIFFRKALKEKVPMTIVGDGLQTRDLTYIADVVQANIKAMESMSFFVGGYYQTLNVGTGNDKSVLEIARGIQDLLAAKNIKSEYVYIDARPGEARFTRADISKTRASIGYEPTVNLDFGLKLQLEYYLKKYDYR